MEIQPTIDYQQMLPQGWMLHGTYRIDRYLASGGFGNTYVATNVPFKETVVIKEFFIRGTAERSSDQCTVSVSQSNQKLFMQQLEKFKKEAQRLRRLSNPHLVRVHDFFEENGTAYYVMDYIDGSSLSEILKQAPYPLHETEVERIIRDLADALKDVHTHSIQHLDIKPGNIMRDKQGHIYLIDFGACKQITSDGSMATTTTSMCYTPGYAPLEQIDQELKSIGAWTDIYALGATTYNLLTQQKPPLPSNILRDRNAFNFPPYVSSRMRNFIMKCMEPIGRQRPQSVDECLQLLNQSVNDRTIAEGTSPVQQVSPRPTKGSVLTYESIRWMDYRNLKHKWSFWQILLAIIFLVPFIGWALCVLFFLCFRLLRGFWPIWGIRYIEATDDSVKIYCNRKRKLGLYGRYSRLTSARFVSVQRIMVNNKSVFILERKNKFCIYNSVQRKFLFVRSNKIEHIGKGEFKVTKKGNTGHFFVIP